MNVKVGDKIRVIRKQKGLTLKQLAENKVTAAQISAVENGKCNPSKELLEHISAKLEMDLEYFTQSDEERCSRCFEKCMGEGFAFYNNGEYDSALEHIKGIADIMTYLDESQKGSFYYFTGNCFYQKQEYSEAFEHYIKALTCYLTTRDIEEIAQIYLKTGNCLYNRGQYDMALSYYISAERYADDKIDSNTAAKILFDMSMCYVKLNRVGPAKESVKKCCEFINKHDVMDKEKFTAGIDMINGIIDEDSNRKKQSIFNEAFGKYKKENDIIGMGRAKNNEGIWFAEIGDNKKAVECLNEAINYKKECMDNTLSDSYINLAEVYIAGGDSETAMEIINTAEEVMLGSGDSKGLIDVMMEKFDLFMSKKDYDKAEMYGFIVLDCIQKFSDRKSEEKLYFKMSELYKNIGDENSSIQYLLKVNKFIN